MNELTIATLLNTPAAVISAVLFFTGSIVCVAIWLTWWVVNRAKSYATTGEVDEKLSLHKTETTQILDGIADKYQASMIDAANRIKTVFDDEREKSAGYLRNVTETLQSVRVHGIKLDRNFQKIRAALPLLAPADKVEAVQQIFRED